MKRIWTDARNKIEQEGWCRLRALGECEGRLETAHTIGRAHDRRVGPGVVHVDADDCVPLCTRHHLRYDLGEVDLLPYLDPLGAPYREQAAAVRHVGVERARKRLAPSVGRAVSELGAAAGEAAELGGAA